MLDPSMVDYNLLFDKIQWGTYGDDWFPSPISRSYLFLKQIYPDKKHILPDQLMRQGLSALEPGCFAYLPASHFQAVDFEKVDLFTNFFSLGGQTTLLTIHQ